MKYLTKSFKDELTLAVSTIKAHYPTIDRGGCGIFARIIAKQLIKRGFNVEYVLLFRNTSSITVANEHANNNNITGIYNTTWCHVLLKVNGQYIDSGGVYESEEDFNERCPFGTSSRYYIGDPMPKAVMDEFLSHKYRSCWNYTFDRSMSGVIAMQLAKYLN